MTNRWPTVIGERVPAAYPNGINLNRTALFLRELLWLMQNINLEEDADWLLRFKDGEVAGWSDFIEARAPDIIWVRPHDGPRGVVHFRVRNGVGTVTTLNMKDGEYP